MTSPLKKKRKVDSTVPPQNTRSIASYFGAAGKKIPPQIPSTEHAQLTDEQLARKLQTEWNQQGQDESKYSSPSNITTENLQQEKPRVPDGGADSIPSTDNTGIPNTPTLISSKENKPKGILALQSSSAAEDTISFSLPFDLSPLEFDPHEQKENLQAHWEAEGGKASYAILARAFSLVNGTQSRIKIVDILVNVLRLIIVGDPQSLLPAVWLATNAFAPPYVPIELGLGGSAISKALKKAYGLDNQGLKSLYNKHGDAGDVAFEAKKKQSFTLRRPKPLTIRSVYDALMKIANSKGTGSQEAKQRIVEKLLQDTRGAEESRYIVRTLVQHLRIGAVKTTILIALARAFLYSKPPTATFSIRSRAEFTSLSKEELSSIYSQAEETIKTCYARHPNYNMIVPCLLENGVSAELLTKCGITLHIPLLPMLGSITRDLPQMLTRLHGRSFTCEYKYDGQRAQVHCDALGKVSIFSRHLELMTDKYPDLVSLVPQIRSGAVSSFILEGEVVAVNNETGELLPFQTLTNRAKKNVEIGDIKVNVCLFSFDLMYLNGQSLLERPFRERREFLRSLFIEIPNRFTWVKSIDAFPSDSDAALNFFNDALQAKCEGIMVKVLDDKPVESLIQAEGAATVPDNAEILSLETDQPQASTDTVAKQRGGRKRPLLSTYEPDKRLESWLKVKKDYSASSETLDLIPIGAWHGQGRKAKWWSPILLAVRNPETGSLEAVTKCMSGFSDKFYEASKEKYAEGGDNIISRPNYVEYSGEPEVWFQPQEVWEMAFADITLSPTYTAAIGLVSDERGLSLRFPRFLRVREDKSIDEASTSGYIAHLWDKQAEKVKVAEPGPED
ncbi:DNA ligase [Nannizzia gypsea CBS 118893]|uniref:DNA ligase n=1 Tax=Arthroderma gypseum (strain ATCC MYA-4604 / CBS 118893) TaxID=535722 RepID=E5QZZ9_ARTGP|nr:DNA ligase [Nannizzia gypsea CBS 118893]EFQ98248.1 DNA ligase [Nannizzia gypsea CBS 118893]